VPRFSAHAHVYAAVRLNISATHHGNETRDLAKRISPGTPPTSLTRIESLHTKVSFSPKPSSDLDRIETYALPPSNFVTPVMKFAMVDAAEWHGECQSFATRSMR
jgi:hypothetical protein